jgi:hypothetical protein
MQPHESTAGLVADLARLTWEGIALGLAYGLLSMAVLQLFKDLYLRRAFNRTQFNYWFDVGAESATKAASSSTSTDPPSVFAATARADLLNLASAGDENALFGLPIDKLAGQINVAANSVIESPQRHRELLTILGKGSNQADIDMLLNNDSAILRPAQEASPEVLKANSDLRYNYADARTRVSHHIQRTIDVLQLAASQRWTRLNQWISILSCALIGLLIGFAPLVFRSWFSSHYGVFTVSGFLPVSVLLALIGGFLAPLLRDLTAGFTKAG